MIFGKKRISVCYIDSSNLGSSVRKAAEQLNAEYGPLYELHVMPLYSLSAPKTREPYLLLIEQADLVLVDIRGANPLIADILAATRRGKATVASLLGGSFELMSLTRMGIFDANKFFNGPRAEKMGSAFSGITGETNFEDIDSMLKEKLPGFIYKDIGAWFEVTRYWGINGVENIRRMLLFFGKRYCKLRGLGEPLPPLKEPSPAIRHPNIPLLYTDLDSYLLDYGYDSSKPTLVLVSYDGMHGENCAVPTAALIQQLEPDCNVVPISCDGMKNLHAIRSLAFRDGRFIGDALVPLVWFRLNGGPIGGREELTYELFKELDCPVFHPVTVFTDSLSRWKADKNGVSPVDYLANIVLPECDGAIEPLLLCAAEDGAEADCMEIVPIPDRVARYAGRIKRLLRLRRLANSEKRLALIVYNYPPGEHNLGNAAYLDTFASVRNILIRLGQEGYEVGEIPDDLADLFLKENLVNSPQWHEASSGVLIDEEHYARLMAPFPALRQDIEERWGAFPGSVNAVDNAVRLPLCRFGNVMVALQPSRGVHENPEHGYHDKELPPHHQYAAFYRWLDAQVDAIVHVGTHGTLEFFRGKELTPAEEDDADMLLGDMPHFYIYQTGNPSEAMTAKRRAMATLVGYQTPAADAAGLYGQLLVMRDLFAEREESDKLSPQRRQGIEEEIRQMADAQGWQDLQGDLVAIEGRLTEYARAMVPMGLHSFGQAMGQQEILSFLLQVLRLDRGDMRSLPRALAEQKGLDYSALLKQGSLKLDLLDRESEQLLKRWLSGETPDSNFAEQAEYAKGIAGKLQVDCELDGLTNALAGRWAGAALSADSIRNPELLPSGRNLFQFNPLVMPTPAAMERGRIIARNTLEQYRAEKGGFPKSVGVVLWGFETAKTCGESVGQIMEYLGVRVATPAGSWFPQIEIIPRGEIDHPRINVMIEICGFFRDMFPNLIGLIDEAICAVGDLGEEDNGVRMETEALREQLRNAGMDEAEAARCSQLRMFGPAESQYGTSLTTMIETSGWTEESELGNAFLRDMRFAYGKDVRARALPAVEEHLMGNIEMISQVQDTFEYEVTDLDHYYEFFGGFSSAVRAKSGQRPMMLATNTSSETIRTEDLSRAVSRGATTRTLNPKWVDAMLEHKHHGAQKIADRVQYLIGLDATTGSVDESVWEKTAQTFLMDEGMLRRLRENNPYAAHEVAKRMAEADERGYWDATADERKRLSEILMDSEETLEGEMDYE